MPAYPDLTFGAGWTKWVHEGCDAMGGLVAIGKADGPAATTAIALMTADYRSAGRPDVPTVAIHTGPKAALTGALADL